MLQIILFTVVGAALLVGLFNFAAYYAVVSELRSNMGLHIVDGTFNIFIHLSDDKETKFIAYYMLCDVSSWWRLVFFKLDTTAMPIAEGTIPPEKDIDINEQLAFVIKHTITSSPEIFEVMVDRNITPHFKCGGGTIVIPLDKLRK